MKLTLQLQILPDAEQQAQLLETMERVNAAATFSALIGFESGVFSQPSIHKLAYAKIRENFGLSAQMAVRAIGKAVECFKRDKSRCPVFKPFGAITYDERIMSFKGVDRVSLWVFPCGRTIIPLLYGEYQKQRFDRIKGQADLVCRNGKFYLYCTVNIPESTTIAPTDFLGVDMGIVNIASDSDGTQYSGSAVKSMRHRHKRLRAKLQKKGTRAAQRRLKAISGRERRFVTHTNHVISKQIVAKAKRTERGIAIEDLTGIRGRVTAGRKQRAVLHSWAFVQLRAFITYKALLDGLPVSVNNPYNSSRECSECGFADAGNRPNQSTFCCLACGHAEHADINAARVIASRAACKPAEDGNIRLSDSACHC